METEKETEKETETEDEYIIYLFLVSVIVIVIVFVVRKYIYTKLQQCKQIYQSLATRVNHFVVRICRNKGNKKKTCTKDIELKEILIPFTITPNSQKKSGVYILEDKSQENEDLLKYRNQSRESENQNYTKSQQDDAVSNLFNQSVQDSQHKPYEHSNQYVNEYMNPNKNQNMPQLQQSKEIQNNDYKIDVVVKDGENPSLVNQNQNQFRNKKQTNYRAQLNQLVKKNSNLQKCEIDPYCEYIWMGKEGQIMNYCPLCDEWEEISHVQTRQCLYCGLQTVSFYLTPCGHAFHDECVYQFVKGAKKDTEIECYYCTTPIEKALLQKGYLSEPQIVS